MAKFTPSVALCMVVTLLGIDRVDLQPQLPADIDGLDIQLVNGNAPNEGRVLIRLSPGSPWTAVCYDASFSHPVPFQMCRRLGYPFACGQSEAGTHRTDDGSLVDVPSGLFLTSCSADQTNRAAGGCFLVPVPSSRSACTHDQDMWLSCGEAGMSGFELRLVGGSYRDPEGLLQARCDAGHEWSAVCGNYFHRLKAGRVACRELGYSDQAVRARTLFPDELDAPHRPNYTLFVDIGCIGNEMSLTECQHYSLRECEYFVTLECFTCTPQYDEKAYLCGSKQLCGDECGQKHPVPGSFDDEFHYCQCDDACSIFDDCCYDFAESCGPEQPSLSRGRFTTDQFGCVWVPGSQFTHTGYVAVSRCPISWTDEGTRDLCERSVNVTDVIGSLPVYDEQDVDFKNIYCAICNGRSLDRLQRWDVAGSNNRLSPTEEQFHPSLNRSLPTKGWFITPPRGHAVIRECPAHLVETCQDKFRGTQLEEACRVYYAPIKLEDSDTRYRNPHCAICNGRNVEPRNSCMDQVCQEWCEPSPWGPCYGICSPYDDFFTIEVLFDLSSSSSPYSDVSCSEGKIYDPFLEVCRVLTCAAGYHIQDNECVAAPSSPPTSKNDSSASVAGCLSEASGKNASDRNVNLTGQIYTIMESNSSRLSLSVLVSSALEALEFEMAFDNLLGATDNSSLDSLLPCNISSVSVFLPFSLNGPITCTNFTVDGEEIFPGYSGKLLAVVKFQDSSEEEQYSKTKVSPLCLKIYDLNCSSLLTLKESEYKSFSDESIELVATGASLSINEYVLFPDGTAVVCSFIGPVPVGLEPQIRRAISFAGSCLSLVAMAGTFVTYCVFPELRNVAGMSTMNLVVALFTAILLFLLAGFLGQSTAACEFGAIMAHFSWLAAFFWMTMLAINVARTVTSRAPRRDVARTAGCSRPFLVYMSLAWGTPLVIVIICLILNYCDCTSLPAIYAEGGICWITDTTARVVAFVVPVAATLVLNVCLFVFTIVSLRRSRHATKAVRKQTKVEGAREELIIYAKLCAIVGITWLFGFLTQSVTGLLAFSYIYIILNYLQGVFIFVAFCFNKRVRGLWREKMRKERRKSRKSRTHAPTPKAKESTLTASTAKEVTEETKL